jgi:O-antigen/teichoic acid export membrane protein
MPAPPPSLSHKTAWNFSSGVALIAGRFGAGLLVARLLGPDALGRTVYLLWLADITATATQMALPASLTRFLAERIGAGDDAQGAALRRWIWNRFTGFTALGMIVIALAGWRAGVLPTGGMTAVLSVYFLAQSFWTLVQADLAGQGRFATTAKINVIASGVLFAAVAVGAHTGGVAGAMAGYLIGTVFAAAAGMWCLRGTRVKAAPDAELRRAVWRFAGQTWLAVVLGACVWGRLELFFLERYWGADEVAMFSVGLSLVTMASQGPVLLADALMPHFAGLSGTERRTQIPATYSSATRLIAILVLPLTLGGAAIMPVLLPWIYGPDFGPAVAVATVLVAGAGVQVGVVGGTVIYGLGRASFIALLGTIGAVLAGLGGVMIIPEWGAWGAAWARTAIQFGMVGAGFWFVQVRLGCPVPWTAIGRALLAAAGCAAVARAIISVWPAPLALLPAVAAGAAVYVGAVRGLRILHADDAAGLANLGRQFPLAIAGRWLVFVKWMAP